MNNETTSLTPDFQQPDLSLPDLGPQLALMYIGDEHSQEAFPSDFCPFILFDDEDGEDEGDDEGFDEMEDDFDDDFDDDDEDEYEDDDYEDEDDDYDYEDDVDYDDFDE